MAMHRSKLETDRQALQPINSKVRRRVVCNVAVVLYVRLQVPFSNDNIVT